jgi:hypothetical protein
MTLSPAAQNSVAAARRKRNLESCLYGILSKCDLSLLTAPEFSSVNAAQTARLRGEAAQ